MGIRALPRSEYANRWLTRAQAADDGSLERRLPASAARAPCTPFSDVGRVGGRGGARGRVGRRPLIGGDLGPYGVLHVRLRAADTIIVLVRSLSGADRSVGRTQLDP